MIYLSLVQNVALLVALSFIHGLMLRRNNLKGVRYPLFSGLLFGGVALVGMMTPVTLQPGLIFDGRSIIMTVAGLFGGPVTAFLAALIAASYRYWLGGVGAVGGVGVIIGTATIGIVWHYLRRNSSKLVTPAGLYLLGLLAHLWMIAWLVLLLPPAASKLFFANVAIPVILIYPFATLLVCHLFLHMERHIAIEKDLERERKSLNSLVHAIPDLLFELDLDGRYHICPARNHGLLAAPPEAMLGKTVRSVLPPGAAEVCMEALKEAQERGFSRGRQFNLSLPDGDFWFELSVARKEVEPSEEPRFVVLSRDISLRKQHEKELLASRHAAEAANRAKSEFLANMSHEIRTPMNGLMGMLQLLRFTGLTQEQKEYLGHMELCSKNLLAVLNDILDLSKIEAGGIELEKKAFPLASTIIEVVQFQTPAARQKSLELSSDLADDLPEEIMGDQLRLKQILLNLLGHAIKFTESGSITLTARIVSGKEAGSSCLHIEVEDTGIGISADQLKFIFAPFTQADSSTTRKFGGTGLGLTICRRLTELMGGRIWAESSPGKGSIFIIELPFNRQS